ncbi:polysaccharide biosynthesis protein [Cellulosilyticum ruminicola]|uniref:polysaccharide biosynthesis protein n=1 Tax=Cellulosilyticum ruminicola TaxID=425254 RepID=UPI0006CFB270|nr:polysaccharide biosynthesis protein [Cellulosilyticum ruminicola]
MYKDQVVFVTGGTGSWGHELVRQLLKESPKEIRIFSRGELSQVKMEREFRDSRLKFVIGDIRDLEAITAATEGVDYVFHLAALKHVPICELQPNEAVKTNIVGTQNLIKACIKNKVKKVIDVSTDKAVDALNLYGMTKAVGERLIIQANLISKNTKFVCIRAGNVLGSNGSVVPFFINQIKELKKVTITDPKMTRYFITLPEAISLLFKAVQASVGGEIFVMRMPAYRIKDVAEVLIEDSGEKNIVVENIGIRPGEKLDEVLVSEHESGHTYMYDETYYVIMPTIDIPGLKEHYTPLGLKKVDFIRYTSADFILEKSDITLLLKKGKYLK